MCARNDQTDFRPSVGVRFAASGRHSQARMFLFKVNFNSWLSSTETTPRFISALAKSGHCLLQSTLVLRSHRY